MSAFPKEPADRWDCSSCSFCRSPQIARFAASPYRRLCMQAPFVTECNKSVENCINTVSTRGGCVTNNECAPGSTCVSGRCQGTFNSGLPKAVGQLTFDDYQRYLEATTGDVKGMTVLKSTLPMTMVEHKGRRFPVALIPSDRNSQPQCRNCLQSLWQCDQLYSEADDYAAYQACKVMEDCFVYDLQYPDGQVHPVAVKLNNHCVGAAQAALESCAVSCASCSLR